MSNPLSATTALAACYATANPGAALRDWALGRTPEGGTVDRPAALTTCPICEHRLIKGRCQHCRDVARSRAYWARKKTASGRTCAAPGCDRLLWPGNTSGVCRWHNHQGPKPPGGQPPAPKAGELPEVAADALLKLPVPHSAIGNPQSLLPPLLPELAAFPATPRPILPPDSRHCAVCGRAALPLTASLCPRCWAAYCAGATLVALRQVGPACCAHPGCGHPPLAGAATCLKHFNQQAA